MNTLQAAPWLVLPVLILTTACSDLGPVDSAVIALTINSMNSSDIDPPGIIEKDENISTETGNPWGEFIRAAEDLCGDAVSGFEVLSATLGLDVAGSSGVSVLEDVISGDATVFFSSTRGNDATAVRVDVASMSGVSGTGPVNLPVTATRAQLQTLFERLLGGDFHVGLRAETDRLDSDSFSMDARVSISARAHCE
jgi:hypothetical protein